jgi:hypothetical protein
MSAEIYPRKSSAVKRPSLWVPFGSLSRPPFLEKILSGELTVIAFRIAQYLVERPVTARANYRIF